MPFILEKLERNAKGFFPTEPGVIKDNHHIIPKHMGGVNKPFNLIYLTKDEHIHAHELLYDTFKHPYDNLAVRFRKKKATKRACESPYNALSGASVNSLEMKPLLNVPDVSETQKTFQRLAAKGKECGFIFIGVLNFEKMHNSAVEFFCCKHKVFITRLGSAWTRCFNQKNLMVRPACCFAEQQGKSLDITRDSSVKLTSNFSIIPEEVKLLQEGQEETLENLNNIKIKVKTQKTVGIPEKMKEKMTSLGHVVVGEPPRNKKDRFCIHCKKHGITATTYVDNYRANTHGMRCCSMAYGDNKIRLGNLRNGKND